MFKSKITPMKYPALKNQVKDTKVKNQLFDQTKEKKKIKKAQKKIADFQTFLKEKGINYNFKVSF